MTITTSAGDRDRLGAASHSLPRGSASVMMAAIASLVLLAGLIYPGAARAIGHWCPWGTCDITDPVYVNVYWDDSEDKWNADIAASDPSATVARIDALTQSVIHSSYFAGLLQYSVNSVSSLPSIVVNGCGPPPATIDQVFDQMNTFAGCVFGAHPEYIPGQTILTVFVPPQVVPASPTADFCAKASAHHDQYRYPIGVVSTGDGGQEVVYAYVQVSVVPTAVVPKPTDPTATPTKPCNKTLGGILAVETHEMVEAATDPVPNSPTGWKNFGTEIADQCAKVSGGSVNFLFGRVATYWSNGLNGCIATQTPAPTIASTKVCGTGSAMMITLTGKFSDAISGAPPWDLKTTPAAFPAPASSRTMYLNATITAPPSKKKWTAGNYMGFPADIVGLGKITWTVGSGNAPDTIVINGFDEHYGVPAGGGFASTVAPGDTIKLAIFSPDSGLGVTTTVTAPAPASVSGLAFVNPLIHFNPPPPIFFGDHPTVVTGKLLDGGGCGVQNATVSVIADDPGATAQQGTTTADGSFSIPYPPNLPLGGHAGHHTIKVIAPVTAQTVVAIHPVADHLSATVGAVAGQQPVTLTGAGYAAGLTSVVFRSGTINVPATMIAVPDSNTATFLTPASPLNGAAIVHVVASVDGVESEPLAYRYVVPNQPVLSIVTAPQCPTDTTALRVDAYNADGSAKAEMVTLTASPADFLVGSATQATATVATGGSVLLKAPAAQVVFTAAPVGGGSPTTVQKKKLAAPGSHCVPVMAGAVLPQPGDLGPVESVSLPALAGRDSQTVMWASRQSFAQATHYVLSSGAGSTTKEAIADVEVRDVGSRELSAAIGTHPDVAPLAAGGTARFRFVGPGLSLQSKTGQAAAGTTSRLTVTFPLALNADPSSYHVLLLAPDSTAWTEQTASAIPMNDGFVLRAPATGHGVYVLARAVNR